MSPPPPGEKKKKSRDFARTKWFETVLWQLHSCNQAGRLNSEYGGNLQPVPSRATPWRCLWTSDSYITAAFQCSSQVLSKSILKRLHIVCPQHDLLSSIHFEHLGLKTSPHDQGSCGALYRGPTTITNMMHPCSLHAVSI